MVARDERDARRGKARSRRGGGSLQLALVRVSAALGLRVERVTVAQQVALRGRAVELRGRQLSEVVLVAVGVALTLGLRLRCWCRRRRCRRRRRRRRRRAALLGVWCWRGLVRPVLVALLGSLDGRRGGCECCGSVRRRWRSGAREGCEEQAVQRRGRSRSSGRRARVGEMASTTWRGKVPTTVATWSLRAACVRRRGCVSALRSRPFVPSHSRPYQPFLSWLMSLLSFCECILMLLSRRSFAGILYLLNTFLSPVCSSLHPLFTDSFTRHSSRPSSRGIDGIRQRASRRHSL